MKRQNRKPPPWSRTRAKEIILRTWDPEHLEHSVDGLVHQLQNVAVTCAGICDSRALRLRRQGRDDAAEELEAAAERMRVAFELRA